MKKLHNPSFTVQPGLEPTTQGIRIIEHNFPCCFSTNKNEDASPMASVKTFFWDFGGQEIYHATHQFFLTKRSLYLFVWEARKEEESRHFDYWLNVIKLLGSILFFRHDSLLANTVILKPEWPTLSVYALIDARSILDKKGRLTIFRSHRIKKWEYTICFCT